MELLSKFLPVKNFISLYKNQKIIEKKKNGKLEYVSKIIK
jgi:hypothetical protein